MVLDRPAYEKALQEAERALARDPSALGPMFLRAQALDGLGETEKAMEAYHDVLRHIPTDGNTLIALGALAIRVGQYGTAKTMLTRAVEAHPDRALAHVNMGLVLCNEGQLEKAREHFETALRLDPDNRAGHCGLALVLLWLGEPEAAKSHARKGFRGQAYAWPFRGTGEPVSLLLVLSAVGSNVPIEPLVDDRVFQKWTVAPQFFDPGEDLPPHDVVFNSVGDVDSCGPALDAAEAMLSRSKVRVLNPPSKIRATGRVANAQRLARIADVVTPRIEAWSREALSAPDAVGRAGGFGWPLLLRSPGYHTGEHFVKVDAAEDLQSAAAGLPGDPLLVIEFLDLRGADGTIRKYRAMMVDGCLYPLHLAISSNWKVHYFSADMAERADYRAEDEAFLNDMPGVLGKRAMRALERIRDVLELDYGGIDFALDGQGRVVVFEANATMVVPLPDTGEQWTYRRAPVLRVRAAVERMLLKAAGRGQGSA
jgi:tetratricopeptide (TPR) repeat protein